MSGLDRMSAGDQEAPAGDLGAFRWRPGRQLIHIFLACLGLHLAWALAMPVTSAPDEPAHIYRAVSLWEGNLLPSGRAADGFWNVQVPASVVEYAESTACFRWRPQVSAGCSRPAETSGDNMTIETGAGRYFPLYYYAVGWPGTL
ncbi:MAG TPA: DUF2142 domain-containing protein, partial [Kineosporiaceae bacterium]|nr:DUF2142 domain-containing protein [Kineosporiaceae bacterium]